MASPKPKSLSDEISIGSGSGGRYASKNCPALRATLPNWVSDWKRCHVERVLHVFYEQNTSGLPPQLLEKIPKMKKKTSEQKQYIDVLRDTNFGPNLIRKRKWRDCTWDYHYDETMKKLDEAPLEAESKESLLPRFGPLMHIQFREYVHVLKLFVKQRRENWTEQENEDEFKEPHVFEEEYSLIISAFAKLCGLSVSQGIHLYKSEYFLLEENEQVFGHPGYGGQMAYADPKHNVGIAYVTNDLSVYGFGNDPKFKALEKELYSCLDNMKDSDLASNYQTLSDA